MRCEYDDPIHPDPCPDVAVCRIDWGVRWAGNTRIIVEDPSYSCLSHARVACEWGKNKVTMFDGSAFEYPEPLNGGEFGHCEDGHDPVGWRGAVPCFMCAARAVEGSIFDLSHEMYYGPGDPVPRWRVLEPAGS